MEIRSTMLKSSILEKVFTLRELAALGISRKLWSGIVIRQSLRGDVIDDGHFDKVVICRKVLLDSPLTEAVFKYKVPGLAPVSKDQLLEAAIWIQNGFIEALAWEKRCQKALPFTTLNPKTANRYWAGYYVTPAGQFDELTFAKRFVADETQPMLSRFILACFYCFEDVIRVLWCNSETRDKWKMLYTVNRRITDMNKLGRYELELDEWWVRWLEEGCTDKKDKYYANGLKFAAYHSFEFAVRFFWKDLPLPVKNDFLLKYRHGDVARSGSNYEVRFVHFFWSLLPVKKKKTLFTWSTLNFEATDIFRCLFLSPLYEVVLDDIFSFPHPIPLQCYVIMRVALTSLMEWLDMPIHEEILTNLLSRLTPDERLQILFYGMLN